MNVRLNIQEDAELRDCIKEAIDGQIRAIVRSEVEKTVINEVARILPRHIVGGDFANKLNKAIDISVIKVVNDHAAAIGFTNAFIAKLVNDKIEIALSKNDWQGIVDAVAKEKIKAMVV